MGTLALLTSLYGPVWAADQDAPQEAGNATANERTELFIALLRRRALKLLEARRPPPPKLFRVSTAITQGYESNVNLDGDKLGDFFTRETLSVTARPPRITSWLSGEFRHRLVHTHYAEFRDTNLWMNTLGGVIRVQPHKRVRVDVGYEYAIVNFPFNTANSYFDKRTSVELRFAQTRWLSHQTRWTYQFRNYDTRKARNPSGVALLGVNREDQRHTIRHKLLFKFPKTSVTLSGRFYRNFSNDLRRDFYDWEDYKIRGILTRALSEKWVGLVAASFERRNYQKRRVPRINVAERDNSSTLGASFIYAAGHDVDVMYSLTYRHQDSNDPRLDFHDWINQVTLDISF